MRKISSILFLFLFVVSLPDSEAADWSQRWQQSSTEIWNGEPVGQFDQMAVWATNDAGVVFGDPAFSNFSTQSWTAYNEAGNIGARALSAMPLSYVQFDMNYATQFGAADFLYICAYQGESRQRQHIMYNPGSGWSYPPFTGTDAEWHAMGGGDPIPVPEPSTFLLFLAWPILLCYNFRR